MEFIFRSPQSPPILLPGDDFSLDSSHFVLIERPLNSLIRGEETFPSKTNIQSVVRSRRGVLSDTNEQSSPSPQDYTAYYISPRIVNTSDSILTAIS